MLLLKITARAHPAGNRIDLTWDNPNPVAFPGVRVVRRENTHPVTPDDGVTVVQGTGLRAATDAGLRGETVYYYSLFPFKGNPPQFEGDPHNRASAMATAPYDFPGLMFSLLPLIYHRYDLARLPSPGSGVAPEDLGKGALRRFLDLPGYQFDQFYSLARAMLNFYNLDRVEGSLLPLLAQWIGWNTDFRLEAGTQRNEIRFAPYLYETIGVIPTVEATVKRITNWESRTKEFVHNVARTNQPERLNLWSAVRDAGGNWGKPAVTSLNWVYEGRPAAVRDLDGSQLFFYHTYKLHGWDIWSKRFSAGQWLPSEPVVDQTSMDKHPTAALQGSRLWLFWENYDTTLPLSGQHWRINFRTRENGVWSAVGVFGDDATERQKPATVADDQGGVWLFWQERVGNGWQVKYNRHNGTAWELASAASLPLDGGQDPRVEDDLLLVFHPSSANQRLWLFWARQEAGGPPGQSRWTVAYRIKQGLGPNVSDWSQVRLMPKTGPGGYHDREPAAQLATGGNIELFWSSTQNGTWSVWNNTLNIGTLNFGAAQQVTTSPFSGRAPLAASQGATTLLVFRSNESLEYTSAVYGATRTLDVRYAGSTTVDSRAAAKLALRGLFEDFLTYTYDAGQNGKRSNDDRIARDTVGLYLTPDIVDLDQIKAIISRLNNVLPGFIPITERAVFIV